MEKPIVGKRYIYTGSSYYGKPVVEIMGYHRESSDVVYYKYVENGGFGFTSLHHVFVPIPEPLKLLQEVFVKGRIGFLDIPFPHEERVKIEMVEFIAPRCMSKAIVSKKLIYIRNPEGKIVPYCGEENG